MTLDKSEAAQALAEIGASARRSSSLYSYNRSAPYLFIAGVMWLVADLLTQFTPYKSLTWPVVSAIGTIVFIAVAIMQTRVARRDGAYAMGEGARAGQTGVFWKICGVWLAIFAFMVASFIIFPPTNEFQPHTFIGVFCGCLYVAVGMWMGWRMVAVGVALAGLSLFGFFEVRDYYLVFMGVVGGGALMLSAFLAEDRLMNGPDEIIHQSTRLKLMATLRGLPLDEMLEFTRLKAILKATDGNLGTHLTALEKAGYIEVTKDFLGKKPRTRVAMTRTGRAAFENHVAYLKDIIEG